MALPGWSSRERDPPDGGVCWNDRARWQCSQMKRDPADKDMSAEWYKCERCGATISLDYDEMR